MRWWERGTGQRGNRAEGRRRVQNITVCLIRQEGSGRAAGGRQRQGKVGWSEVRQGN